MSMEFLSVSMAVGFLLPMGKNENLRFVQTVLHIVAFDDCPENFHAIFFLGHLAGKLKIYLVLKR